MDLVLVRAPIKLEQWLPLLDRNVWLNKYGRNQRWIREPRNQLDGVLNHASVRRIRGRKAHADQKNQQYVDAKKDAYHSPGDAEFQKSQFEEDQPDYRREDHEEEKRGNHLRS